MKTRKLWIKRKYFHFLKERTKTLEIRVGYSNIRDIQPGENILFLSKSRKGKEISIVLTVLMIRKYKNFELMTQSENTDKIVPGISKDHLLSLLQRIYPPSKEKLGVYVIELG